MHQVHRGLGRLIPYFRNPENILRCKLDLFLLLWMFVAGIMKEMDQSATTQAYVSGMREDLGLWDNELNWFQTYFSIAYALFIVPLQMLADQAAALALASLRGKYLGATRDVVGRWFWKREDHRLISPCPISTYKAGTAGMVYVLRFFLGMMSATSWPGITSLILTWYTPGELALRLAIFNVSDVAGAMFLDVVQASLSFLGARWLYTDLSL